MLDWSEMISDFLTRTVDMFLKYHVTGTMDGIKLCLSPMNGMADVVLTIDGAEHTVDFDDFRCATEDCERDVQRECYFENESIWVEFFMMMEENLDKIKMYMEQVKDALAEHYNVSVSLDFDEE